MKNMAKKLVASVLCVCVLMCLCSCSRFFETVELRPIATQTTVPMWYTRYSYYIYTTPDGSVIVTPDGSTFPYTGTTDAFWGVVTASGPEGDNTTETTTTTTERLTTKNTKEPTTIQKPASTTKKMTTSSATKKTTTSTTKKTTTSTTTTTTTTQKTTTTTAANEGTKQLAYKLSDDGTYYICTGLSGYSLPSKIVIPAYYKDKPVKAVIGNGFVDFFDTVKEIVLSEGIEELGRMVIYCAGLESITIPKSMKAIHGTAFSGCGNLETVYFEEESGWTFRGESVDFSDPYQAANLLRSHKESWYQR